MPEPSPAGARTPTDPTASTPAKDASHSEAATARDKQTTSKSDPLMDALGIPKDVQSQISEADNAKETAPAQPANEPEAKPEIHHEEHEGHAAEAELSPEGEAEEDEDETTPPAVQGEQPPKLDKRQKRINRLTRQKS